jgi:transcriptional accessory protein Tex/SPT6
MKNFNYYLEMASNKENNSETNYLDISHNWETLPIQNAVLYLKANPEAMLKALIKFADPDNDAKITSGLWAIMVNIIGLEEAKNTGNKKANEIVRKKLTTWNANLKVTDKEKLSELEIKTIADKIFP